MAGSIKGIIVEIGGDTSGLQKALSKVNSATSSLSRELKGVNSLLKLDPKNTELQKQKQDILNESIVNTQDKLKQLQELKEQADDKMANGTEINSENYRALQREIINTENKLKNLQVESSKLTQVGRKFEEIGTKIQNVGNKIDSLGNKLTTRVTTPLVALGVIGVKSAAEQEASMQQVELIYGEASNTIKDFAENTAITFNMSTKEAYKYSQVYGNLIQSITDDEEENALYTQQLLKASSVIASATGRTMEDVMDRIRSGLLGNTEAIEDLGVNVNVSLLESTDAFKKFAGDKSWDQLDFQTQQQIRLFGILEQTTKKYGTEVNKNTASSIQKLTARLNNLISRLNKKLIPIAEDLMDIADDFIDELENLSDEQMENIIQIGLMIAKIGPFIKILGTVTKTVGTASKGIGIFSQAVAVARNNTTSNITSVNNLAKALNFLRSPMGLITISITGTVAAAMLLTKETYKNNEAIAESAKELENTKNKYNELIQEQKEALDTKMTEIDNTQKLTDELKTLVDENGKVKDGYKDRVSFILNELNGALDTEYSMTGDVINNYKELTKTIDELMIKKRANAILEAEEARYDEAIDKKTDAYDTMIEKEQELAKAKEELLEKEKKYNEYKDTYSGKVNINYTNTLKVQVKLQEQAVNQAEKNLSDSKEIYNNYLNDIATYENDFGIVQSNNTKKIQEMITSRTYSYKQESEDIGETINHNIKQVQYEIAQYKKAREEDLQNQDEINAEKNKKQIEAGEKQLDTLAQQLLAMTSTTEELTPQQIEAWENLSKNSLETYTKYINKMSPEMQKKIQDITGVIVSDTSIEESMEELAKDAEKGFNNNVDGETWGKDLTKEMADGMTSSKSKSWITGASSSVAGWIKSILGFSIPERGPLSDFDKSMPDMIDLMIKGIDSNKLKLIKSAERLAKNLNSSLNLQSNIPLNNFENAKLSSQVIDSTKTIFTTPQIVFNVQELDEARLNQCFNYVNRKFGSQY